MTTALTPAQAAPVLGVRPMEVIRLCRAGELAGALKAATGPWLIPVEAIAARVMADLDEERRPAFRYGLEQGRMEAGQG